MFHFILEIHDTIPYINRKKKQTFTAESKFLYPFDIFRKIDVIDWKTKKDENCLAFFTGRTIAKESHERKLATHQEQDFNLRRIKSTVS